MSEKSSIQISGHVLINDRSGEIYLDKANAVHNKNMAIALARGLSNNPPNGSGNTLHQIFKIKLGNGGSTIDSSNQITFLPPNVTGASADLWSPTYEELVDELNVLTPPENSVTYQESPAPDDSTIVIVSAVIGAGEPSGQDLTDTPPNPDPNAQFAFDELGLFTADDRLLTHIVFSPILKTANRELVITYTLTISVT